jgi:hypothetical protein
MIGKKNSFSPQVEQLETRLMPASIFQVQTDVSRFINDVPAAINTGIQAGRDIVVGWYTHNQAEYSRGPAEYNAAVGTIEGDYRRVQNDLSALQNVQAGISRLPTFQRMEADTGNLLEGGLIAVYGAATLNNTVMQNGLNFAKGAASDYVAAIDQAITNLFQTAPQNSYNPYGDPQGNLILTDN